MRYLPHPKPNSKQDLVCAPQFVYTRQREEQQVNPGALVGSGPGTPLRNNWIEACLIDKLASTGSIFSLTYSFMVYIRNYVQNMDCIGQDLIKLYASVCRRVLLVEGCSGLCRPNHQIIPYRLYLSAYHGCCATTIQTQLDCFLCSISFGQVCTPLHHHRHARARTRSPP